MVIQVDMEPNEQQSLILNLRIELNLKALIRVRLLGSVEP
jgi:hypothetical protein